MKLIRAIAMCLILPTTAAAGSFVVGNGGEVVLVNGRYYLRDLFESANYLRPAMGTETNPTILARLRNSSVASLPVSLELLAQKLTEIEHRVPGLGAGLVEVLSLYTWITVENELEQVHDDCDDGTILKNVDSLQIANRYLNEIRLNGKIVARLAPEQLVAVVLHEGVYSLLAPRPTNIKNCSYLVQPAAIARSIVAQLFSDRVLSAWQLTQLSLRLGDGKPQQISLEGLSQALPAADNQCSLSVPWATYKRCLARLCREITNLQIASHRPIVISGIMRFTFAKPRAYFFTYRSRFGAQQATGLSVLANADFDADKPENCAPTLERTSVEVINGAGSNL